MPLPLLDRIKIWVVISCPDYQRVTAAGLLREDAHVCMALCHFFHFQKHRMDGLCSAPRLSAQGCAASRTSLLRPLPLRPVSTWRGWFRVWHRSSAAVSSWGRFAFWTCIAVSWFCPAGQSSSWATGLIALPTCRPGTQRGHSLPGSPALHLGPPWPSVLVTH